MSDRFEAAVTLASEQLLARIYSRYESEDDLRVLKELSVDQADDLGRRILALPDDDIAMLLYYYSFDLSYDDISELLQRDVIKGKLQYIERILSSGMGLAGNEGIGKESMRCACKVALEEYTKVEEPLITPRYSRRFIRKMRKLKVIRGHPIYIQALQKIAIIFIVLGVSFSAALGVNAEFRERVFRWFVETFPQFSEFRLGAAPAGLGTSFEELQLFRPTFIPEGYYLESVFEMYPSIYLDYFNNDRDILTIIGHLPEYAIIALNTEDADVEIVSFRGEDAFYWTLDGVSYFVFVIDGYHFNIVGRIDKELIVQIAESLEVL